jgi:hypothetical protein
MPGHEAVGADVDGVANAAQNHPQSLPQTVRTMYPGFRHCFQEHLRRAPGPYSGNVRFTVDATGQLGKIRVEGAPKELVPCIENVVRASPFSPPGRQQLVKVPLKLVASPNDSDGAPCLPYEPALVTLHGVIERREYPGPPNYESIQAGDLKETAWVLRLDHTTCTQASSDALNPERHGIDLIQLVLWDHGYSHYANLVQQHVVATGQLFGAHTGHHHTDVLLTVSTLAADPRR